MLQVNKTLTHLDLSGNYNFSGTQCCIFQPLDLSGNHNFSDSGAYRVFKSLQHNTSLVQLNLSSTGLVATEDTAQALITMLQVNKTLTHLDLSGNYNFSGTQCCIFQPLQHNTTLVYLNINTTGNFNTRYTALALRKLLQVNTTLAHLDLSYNWTFSRISYVVFQGLQHNTLLVHLNISSTGLVATEDTARALTAMLRVNKTIKHLNLSENWTFSNAGAYCVCQGLQHNTSLES